jgi:hypothetical protein
MIDFLPTGPISPADISRSIKNLKLSNCVGLSYCVLYY